MHLDRRRRVLVKLAVAGVAAAAVARTTQAAKRVAGKAVDAADGHVPKHRGSELSDALSSTADAADAAGKMLSDVSSEKGTRRQFLARMLASLGNRAKSEAHGHAKAVAKVMSPTALAVADPSAISRRRALQRGAGTLAATAGLVKKAPKNKDTISQQVAAAGREAADITNTGAGAALESAATNLRRVRILEEVARRKGVTGKAVGAAQAVLKADPEEARALARGLGTGGGVTEALIPGWLTSLGLVRV